MLRDRGWLNFRDGNPDQALDDLLRAYALLRRHASREEAMVAAGRLSMAQFSVRDYPQALPLVDETIAFFREQKAQIRLATALDRRSAILKAAGRLDEALIAATEALRIHESIGDRVGTGLSQMRMCGVLDRTQCAQGRRRTGATAPRSTLSQTSGMDDNDYRTLAALRGRLYLALGRSKEAVAQFDRAIAPGGAQPADDIAELYELRSRAHAAIGNYPAAFTDQGEYLRRMREQGTLDRIREVAQLRVQFENDQEKQKIALLEKDKKLAEERLTSQPRTTQLVAIAGLTGLVTAFFLGYALLSNRRHRAELIRLAERDELTGLLNRRAIVRKAVEYLSRARESKGTLIIGLIDLDHFKSINDRFGHAVGDQLLQRFAVALRTALHTREVFGRYGGEEFLVLFPDSTMEQAREAAERLRTALRDQRAAHRRPGRQGHAEPGSGELRKRRRAVRPGRAPRRHRAVRGQDPGTRSRRDLQSRAPRRISSRLRAAPEKWCREGIRDLKVASGGQRRTSDSDSRHSAPSRSSRVLADAQRRAGAAHDDGVLPEAHAAELAVEAIRLERGQRLDAVERAALLVGGGDGAARAGLDDAQRDLVGRAARGCGLRRRPRRRR